MAARPRLQSRPSDPPPAAAAFPPAASAGGKLLLVSKVVAANFADHLYEEIMAGIVDGRLPEGQKLPPESELAELFGVSRPVVREALARLRADGVLISRRGSGSYVQRRPSADLLSLAPTGGVADVMRCFEFRVALEGEAASMAAERRSDHDLAEIRQALDELDEAIRTGAVGVQADLRFHHAIAQASRNNLFTATMTTLFNAIFQGMNVARRLSLRADAQRLDVVQSEHRRIYEAIKSRNPAAARRAMRTHIDNARRRVLGDE